MLPSYQCHVLLDHPPARRNTDAEAGVKPIFNMMLLVRIDLTRTDAETYPVYV